MTPVAIAKSQHPGGVVFSLWSKWGIGYEGFQRFKGQGTIALYAWVCCGRVCDDKAIFWRRLHIGSQGVRIRPQAELNLLRGCV